MSNLVRAAYTSAPAAFYFGARGTASRSRRHTLFPALQIRDGLEVVPEPGRLRLVRQPALPARVNGPALPPALFDLPAAVVEAALSRFPWTALPVRHHFSQGIYARELTIPAGTLLTGSLHKAVNFHIISEGEITVWGDGVPPEVIEAPFAIVAPAGARRIGYAHRNTVWTTILADPDGCQDPEALLARWTEVPVISAEILAAALPEVLVQMLGASTLGTAGEPRTLPPAGSVL